MLAKINRAGVSVVISNQRIIVGHPKHVLHLNGRCCYQQPENHCGCHPKHVLHSMICKKNTCAIDRERVDAAKYKLRLI